MSGTDLVQNVVVTVATGKNGNDPNLTEFTWPCPMVDNAAPIYFYRFIPTGPGGTPEAAEYTTRFTVHIFVTLIRPSPDSRQLQISRADGRVESAEHPSQPNRNPIPWGIGHLQDEHNPLSAQEQDAKPTGLPPRIPSSFRIAVTSTTPIPMPTIYKQKIPKQQGPEGATEEGENDDTSDEDIGEILASMSRADALRILPTAMKDGQVPSTSNLSAPSQSVFPVVDSNANDEIAAGSYVNGASTCGLSPSTFTILIVSIVVLCIEVAG